MAHAVFAPSGAHRWMKCHGCLAFCKDIPAPPPNVYGADGTVSHTIAYGVQQYASEAKYLVGQEMSADGFTFRIDQERLDRVQWYVDAGAREPGLKFYEVELDMKPVYGLPGQFGTSDRVIYDPAQKLLTVDDLKDGTKKVTVKPGPNWQLISYGGAALSAFEILGEITHIRLRIFQPKLDWADEITYTRAEFLALLAELATGAQAANRMLDGREAVVLTDGPWCGWCPGAGSCPKQAEVATREFPDPVHASRLSEDALSSLLRREQAVINAFAAFRAEATARARLGSKIPGFALTTGRAGPRKWASEVAVEAQLNKHLAGDAYKRTLIGPPEAEKRLKKVEGGKDVWVAMQSHITRSEGEPRLAPEAEVPEPLAAEEFKFADVRSSAAEIAIKDLIQ